MSGTSEGSKKSAITNKERYGDDFYSKLGKKGGLVKGAKGFALMPKEKVREAGKNGGSISRRTKTIVI